MTTVAFRGGVIACDTQLSWGTIKVGTQTKIFRIPGALVGFAGSICDFPKMLEWLAGGRAARFPFPGKGGPDCIFAHSDGTLATVEGSGQLVPVAEEFVSIGTGKAVAYGAFHMGASAAQAVAAAIRFDMQTGGKVMTLKFPKG